MKKPNDSFFGKLMQGLFAFFVLHLLQKFFPENERVEESECENREGGEEKKEAALPKGGAEQTEGQDQPLVIEAEKAESCTMPAGSGREGRKRGKRGILDRIRGLSPEARYRVGNMVLLQSWAESRDDPVSHFLMAAACRRSQAVSKTRLTITASGLGCP